ncbi:MAG: formate dehydrogenase accessory sulfurtransferase FdhD [Ginsengibacter sp.]
MKQSSSCPVEIIKLNARAALKQADMLAVEEPLEIRIEFGELSRRIQKNISVTMRTPGNDFELATGFLFTEGIIKNISDVLSVSHCANENVVKVKLAPGVAVEVNNLERNFYTTSSCGVCGKSSIDAIKTSRSLAGDVGNTDTIPPNLFFTLPTTLRKSQDVFDFTGGLHACGLFDKEGKLLLSREDVGRHNALDKLIGAALKSDMIPLNNYILLLSGRASFELIQKAWMAGINIVAAVGAPSSLAVEMAKESNITLVGFLRNQTLNIYSNPDRIKIEVGDVISQVN